MKKLVVDETYPRNEIGKNMIYNKMKSHYRRVSSAKAKVDSNLPRPPKIVLPLSREICDVVDRNYYPYKHFPKHRRCLKELENHEFQFKPLILSTNTESKLKTLESVYHPPVRTPRRTKSRESNRLKQEETNQSGNESINLAEVDDTNETKELEEQRTVIEKIPVVTKKEMFAQTEHFQKSLTKQPSSYRPLDPSSLHFLRDITDDILRKGVYTDDSLEVVFNYHLTLNKHNLDLKAMENELDRLRDEVGMQRPGLRNSVHSDEEALEALDSLQLDPTFKQEIINSLRLHNAENYHSTIIESEIYNLPSSPKPLEMIEKQNSFEIVQPSSLKEQFSPTVDNAVENKEGESEDEVVEVTSTTSEVSDIEEIEFDITNFVDSFEDEEQDDNEENDNHSATIKSITQSLSAVKSKADSHNGNSEEVKVTQDKHSGGLLDSENNQEISAISEIKESDDNKEEIESVMELKTIKTEEISQEKEVEDNKTNTKSIDDYSSVKTDVKTELPSDLEVGAEDTEEEEEEEEVDKSDNEEKLSKTKELAESESSSDLSSIHTEASDN